MPQPAAPPAWSSYAAGTLARCPAVRSEHRRCSRSLFAVTAGVARIRVRPAADDGELVHVRATCKRCGVVLDVQLTTGALPSFEGSAA